MSLTSMLEAAAKSGTVEVEDGWTQGRAIYGGLTGALLLSAMKGRLRDLAGAAGQPVVVAPLRAITVSFIGPATPGPVQIEAEVLRVGSNVTQCRATLWQGDELVATALAAFGKHRQSALTVEPPHPKPDLGASAAVQPFPYIENLTPDFYRFVELRQVGGEIPFSGASTSELSGWTSLRETPECIEEEHLVLLADAWPPAPIQMLDGVAPGSSLTWTLELIGEVGPESTPADTRFAYHASTDSACHGYAHTHARLWTPDGALAAISRQTITIFA